MRLCFYYKLPLPLFDLLDFLKSTGRQTKKTLESSQCQKQIQLLNEMMKGCGSTGGENGKSSNNNKSVI